jgi:alpha 1,2-mannosyltransferase
MHTWARYLLLSLGIIVSQLGAQFLFVGYALTSPQISLHFILQFTQEDYGRATSLHNIASKLGASKNPSNPPPVPDKYYQPTGEGNSTLLVDRRANATFVILARNTDISGTVRSIRDIEDRFNKNYGYPYVFLNEVPFTEEFKRSVLHSLAWISVDIFLNRRISVLSASKMEFGLIPKEHWYQPDLIDEKKAEAGRNKMKEEKIIYGGTSWYFFFVVRKAHLNNR